MLLIDLGNSRIKWAMWKHNQISDYVAHEYNDSNLQYLLTHNLANITVDRVVFCSVAGNQCNQQLADWFDENLNIKIEQVVTQSQQLGVKNAYAKANTLGVDRWLGLLAAYQRYKKALCVIDCGTAVTIDVVDNSGQHLGGLIIPGINLMQQSLFRGTQKIYSLQGEPTLLAKNTEDAVTGGCSHVLILGLDGLYKKYCKQLESELICVVTGGDGKRVANAMESNCHYEEDLILYGLGLVAQSRN